MADDNLLALGAGFAGGLQGIITPYVQATYQDKLLRRRQAEDDQRALANKEAFLPMSEASDIRKTNAQAEAMKAADFISGKDILDFEPGAGVHPDKRYNKALLPFMIGMNKKDASSQNREDRINREILNYSNAMERNPILKGLREQGLGLSQVDQLVDLTKKGNTVSSAALGTKMARGMSEVGVLTESDVTRYIQSGQLTRKAGDILSRWMLGKPTDATIDEIAQISEVLKSNFGKNVQSIHNNYVNRLSRNYGLKTEDAAYRLDVPYMEVKNEVKRTDPTTGKTAIFDADTKQFLRYE